MHRPTYRPTDPDVAAYERRTESIVRDLPVAADALVESVHRVIPEREPGELRRA